jgi:RimJ/RimL family protein N-acetyltransferase
MSGLLPAKNPLGQNYAIFLKPSAVLSQAPNNGAPSEDDQMAKHDKGSTGSDYGTMIGVIGTHRTDEAGLLAKVSYIIHPEHWGRGFATEAMIAFIPVYWLRMPRVLHLEAEINEKNVGSLNVVRKCGFRECGWMEGVGKWKGAQVILWRLERPSG